MVNHNDKWNVELCTTLSISTVDKTRAKVKCDCNVAGFIGIGMFIDDTYIPKSVKEIFEYVQDVNFT